MADVEDSPARQMTSSSTNGIDPLLRVRQGAKTTSHSATSNQ
jgi:hypothetical protein